MNPLLRLLDANANRAREGLRVLEDLARFVLDRGDLSELSKRLRHEITASIDLIQPDALLRLASRDTPGDVGTDISTPAEFRRTSAGSIASAAAARATEALRCLEEAAKGLGRIDAASRLEQARYATYTLERELVLSLPTGRAPQWRLCVLVTESLCKHHMWDSVVLQAIEGGADCIQLREKSLGDAALLERAIRLVDLCRTAPTRVAAIVNDRADIAMAAKADGVHLGQDDLPLRAARDLMGASFLIGVSTTNLDQALAALGAGADYVGLGPMFPSTTKQKDHIAGPAYVRRFRADSRFESLPHLAIGGITPERLPELRDAGVKGVAVSSVVCSAPNPAQVCREMLAGLDQ